MGASGSRDKMIPAEVASKFTAAELDMLRKSFKDLAQRSPGNTIDKETFLKFFPLPGLHGERLFEVFDHKHTGVLDLEEFVTGLAVSVRGSFDEKVKLIFNIYDIDNNQHVSKEELRTMLHQVPRQALYVLSAKVASDAVRGQLIAETGAPAPGSAAAAAGASRTPRPKDAAPSKVSIEVVNLLVEDAFNSFDLNKDAKLSPSQFRQWVKNTPEVLEFLQSVFPLHETPPAPRSPSSAAEPLSPKIISSASFAGQTSDEVYSMTSCPSPPASPHRQRSRSLLDRVQRGGRSGSTDSTGGSGLGSAPGSPRARFWARSRTSSAGSELSEKSASSAPAAQSAGSASAAGAGLSAPSSESGELPRPPSRASCDSGISTPVRGQGSDAATVAAVDPAAVEMSGVLYKVGRRTRSSLARFFLLRGQVLYYYHPGKMEQPAGIIFLQGCFVAAYGSESAATQDAVKSLRSQFSEAIIRTKKGLTADQEVSRAASGRSPVSQRFGFELITSQGGERDSRVLFAKSEAERQAWISAIRRASNVVPFESKYHRLEMVGRGKFATVFKCEMLGENEGKAEAERQYYAVKVIDKGELNEGERDLLRTEIAVLKLVNHPNIINMDDVFESLNHMYIVLEWVEGGELFDRIVGRARLQEIEAFPLVKQLAEAVCYLHMLGVAHRDIKPENILCSGRKEDPVWESTLKICDFGLSKLISPQGVMHLACGTLSYVAPEVLSSKGYGKAADIWNIGVILYLVRRGKLPFDGETKDEVIFNTIYSELDIEHDPIFSKASADHVDLLQGLLNKDPLERLTAQQVLDHPWMVRMEVAWRAMHPDKLTFLDAGSYATISSPAQSASSLEDQTLLGQVPLPTSAGAAVSSAQG